MGLDLAGSLSWANNDVINTPKTLSLARIAGYGLSAIHIHNPGAVALTAKVRASWTDSGSNARKSEIAGMTMAIPAGKTVGAIFNGLGVFDDVDLLLTNDVAVGAAGAFTAQIGVEVV